MDSKHAALIECILQTFPGSRIVSRPVFRVLVFVQECFGQVSILMERLQAMLDKKKSTHRIVLVLRSARTFDDPMQQYVREQGFNLEVVCEQQDIFDDALRVDVGRLVRNVDAVMFFGDRTSAMFRQMHAHVQRIAMPMRIVDHG